MLERIKGCFTESIQTQIAAAEALPDAISRAAMTLVQSLLNGNKILCCGNGTSAANAQHFAASMINRFETERPSLPAIALNADNVVLTAIANDRLHQEVYAKQVRALGHAGDVLLAISTRGNSRDIVKAVEAAVTRDMTIVALTGYDGGELAGLLGPQDVEIRIPSHRSAPHPGDAYADGELFMRSDRQYAISAPGWLIANFEKGEGMNMKAITPVAVLISALLLQGCVGAVVVGSAAVATKTATDPRTVGTQVDDGTLELRVNSALNKDEQIKKEARINVTAYQGKVLLAGQSPNPDLASRAKQIALGVDGATEVYNEIRIMAPVGLGVASSDTWITTKVRSQLLTSDQVKSSNVKVTTENGEVFLLGLVTEREGKAAADIASRVSGVKHVTTAFTILK
ncbi:DnaA initiator-associating protein diaA [Cedecea neteri]|uniref:DnaA initiator-associating protein diaA n=2 Tax=Cedecea neteri TaxID=158822 RepID=A0A2X2TB85_9ENTR|nr:DnaA initiator-associating protein diaA [Cedecea neteri]